MDYTRVLHPNDYSLFKGHQQVQTMMDKLGSMYRYEHMHRRWEYGLALDFLLENGAKTVLDVGGGGSVLSPLLAWNGMKVTQTDVAFGEKESKYQSDKLGVEIEFVQADFSEHRDKILDMFPMYDAVVSISTIEHVKDDEIFFRNMCELSSDLVFLTTDFHPSGKAFSDAHRRTYNAEMLDKFREIAEYYDFYTEPVELRYAGNFVYDYTFASMAFRKYHG